MLAKVNVDELPIPADTVHAIHDHPDATTHITRATQLGLLEEGTDPETNQPRYFVSNVLRPLIRPLLTDTEIHPSLRRRRPLPSPNLAPPNHHHRTRMTTAQWVEVHRLAVAGQEAGIAREVGDRISRVWLVRSRFTDAARVSELTLTLGDDAGAFYDLGWTRRATGDPAAAQAAYEQALALYRANSDRAGEATTLSNIGAVYDGLGDRVRALEFCQQALPSPATSATGPAKPPPGTTWP